MVSVTHLNGVTILTVSGKVDITNDDLLLYVSALDSQSRKLVLIDLSGVQHVDTKGVGQVVNCHQQIKSTGQVCWVIEHRQEQVRSTLQRMGLMEYLDPCSTVHEAMDRLLCHE